MGKAWVTDVLFLFPRFLESFSGSRRYAKTDIGTGTTSGSMGCQWLPDKILTSAKSSAEPENSVSYKRVRHVARHSANSIERLSLSYTFFTAEFSSRENRLT